MARPGVINSEGKRVDMYAFNDIELAKVMKLITQYATQCRVDELETLKSKHSRTYSQKVTDNDGNLYVNDSKVYISSYETEERIAQLKKELEDE